MSSIVEPITIDLFLPLQTILIQKNGHCKFFFGFSLKYTQQQKKVCTYIFIFSHYLMFSLFGICMSLHTKGSNYAYQNQVFAQLSIHVPEKKG